MPRGKTNAEFRAEVKSLVGEEYTFLDSYKGARTKIRCRHNKCGTVWLVNPSHFLSDGTRCKECGKTGRYKKTDAAFQTQIQVKFNGDIITDDEYRGYQVEMKFLHRACGAYFISTPQRVLQSRDGACPKCWHRKGKGAKSDESFKKDVVDKWGAEYTFLDKYIDAKTKIRCRHNKCGTIWKVSPMSFSTNITGGCPKCKENTEKKTQEEFLKQIYDAVGDEYTVCGKYENNHTKMEFKHVECGYSWRTTPDSFLNGNHRCPKCAGCFRKDTEAFRREVDGMTNSEYEVLGEYINSHTKTKVKHNKCGNVWSTTPNAFLSGTRCPSCAKRQQIERQTRSESDFQKEVASIFHDEYQVNGYHGRHKRISAKHVVCGYEWKPYASQLLAGEGCPKCKESVGERTIRLYLKKNNIAFEAQKCFEDCKDKRKLPFDFYLPEINLMIEYDGRQHFHKNDDYFGGEESFRLRHQHDLIKNQYCIDNGIRLLRIPYTVTGDKVGETIQRKIDELTLHESIGRS